MKTIGEGDTDLSDDIDFPQSNGLTVRGGFGCPSLASGDGRSPDSSEAATASDPLVPATTQG